MNWSGWGGLDIAQFRPTGACTIHNDEQEIPLLLMSCLSTAWGKSGELAPLQPPAHAPEVRLILWVGNRRLGGVCGSAVTGRHVTLLTMGWSLFLDVGVLLIKFGQVSEITLQRTGFVTGYLPSTDGVSWRQTCHSSCY